MPLSLICASHTPLMDRIAIAPGINADVRDAYGRLAEHVRVFAPDLIVQFAPDHYQGFFHQLMPSFCIGTAARSAEDWSIAAGKIDVPEMEAKSLANWLVKNEFDVAVSRDMVVDHGFLQMWQEIFGGFTELPIVPIFINCVASPVPTYRRIRMLGESIGRFALRTEKRVLIVASGGLSHDPPVPDVDNVPAEIRDRLIHGSVRSASEKVVHEERLTEFGRQAAQGKGPCQPLNPEWDRAFLEIIASAQLEEFDKFTEDEVRKIAGRAGNEVLAWVAAASAFSVAGPYDMKLELYHPIPEWIAGMAMISANTRK